MALASSSQKPACYGTDMRRGKSLGATPGGASAAWKTYAFVTYLGLWDIAVCAIDQESRPPAPHACARS